MSLRFKHAKSILSPKGIGQSKSTHVEPRSAIGDDIALLVDLDTQDNADAAIQIAQAIEPAHPYWFE